MNSSIAEITQNKTPKSGAFIKFNNNIVRPPRIRAKNRQEMCEYTSAVWTPTVISLQKISKAIESLFCTPCRLTKYGDKIITSKLNIVGRDIQWNVRGNPFLSFFQSSTRKEISQPCSGSMIYSPDYYHLFKRLKHLPLSPFHIRSFGCASCAVKSKNCYRKLDNGSTKLRARRVSLGTLEVIQG